MAENKLTDKEIIKALNEADGLEHICLNCMDNKGKSTTVKVIDVVDLINRQQAEIERLRENNKAIMQTIADVHTEAIKEYKEKLISEIVNTPTRKQNCGVFYLNGNADRQLEIIDIIKGCEGKEMVGDDK